MQITNNTSLAFGSIQINKAQMTKPQRRIAERLYDAIKYSDKYANYSENNLDIYLLPKNKEMVELRIMDPFSGYFIRDDKGKIVKGQVRGIFTEKFETVLDSMLDTYSKVMEGIMPRPKENISKIMANETEMAKYNPEKQRVFRDDINLFKDAGYTLEDAFETSKGTYGEINLDADFVR